MTSTADKPLVVIATDSTVPSGVGCHMLTLARSVAQRHRIILAFPPIEGGATFLDRASRAGFAVEPICSEDSFGRWLKDVSPVLLHVHAGISWEGHGLAAAGRTAGVPVVRTEHLPYVLTDAAQRTAHRLGIGMVDAMIFVSKSAAETYRQAGIDCDRTATILNGIEAPSPSRRREETRRSLVLTERTPVVVTVARFTAQKDHGLLLAAAQLVLGSLPDIRFLLAGDGPERAAMEDMAAGLGDAVVFLGERDDVPDLLAAADLFVLPSRFEGLPLVILEAMASGLPIVATRIGGIREAVGADYPWLVESGDVDALAACIIQAFTHSERRRRLGTSNRQRFTQNFGADRMGRETAALYQSVVLQKACLA